jgi:hypothetical protein
MSQGLETKALARRWREFSTYCATVMSRMSFSHGVVLTGAVGAPMPRLMGDGRPEPPSPLDAVRNSLAEPLSWPAVRLMPHCELSP